MIDGTIFDIKEFSIHDGPGARITVFLKGCPLRCRWCHNPEGLSAAPQLMHKKNLCTGCGACLRGCDHPECKPFSRCIHACPNGCLRVVGKRITAQELAEKLRANGDFFAMTDGGVTFSGGEPLMQPEFIIELARLLPGIHKAIETSGYARPEVYRKVIGHFDYVMQDIKLVDREAHKRYTGVPNDYILENIAWLKQSGIPYIFRVPMIPGITDTEENLAAIRKLTEGCEVEYLKYNELAGAKYEMLDMTFPLRRNNND
ncbi:MAG: glycyl-radical enzyme activating protein [Ruminococcaceae bacterium]|nr:glycyl-radical enzyme activating protein [Oscillospiraceae bacterium]